MPVFRVEKNSNYTTMCNYHLRDQGLSLKGKGLLSMLLSLPDTWNYSVRGLSSITPDGVDECAHQILFQLDSDDRKIACHKRPEVRGNGSRVLRTQEDWNEWQANSLGAAILMPQSEVDRAMWFINSRKPLTCYGWRFYDSDQVKIDTFCGVFGVSRSAAAIRLEQLGYLNRKKDYEYRDPLEVWP